MKLKNTLQKLFLLMLTPLVTVALFTACGDDNGTSVDPDPELNIVETAQEDNRFSILVDLVIEADLVDALSSEQLTVFAPTNDAFEELFNVVDPSELTQEDLIAILTYHVTEGVTLSSQLDAQQDVTMLNDERTLVQASAAGVLINGSSNVVSADIEASNGVIHAIDEVLLPAAYREPSLVEVAQEAGSFEILLDLVETVGLTTTLQFLGPYTAFAPTDEAFQELFQDVNPETLTPEQIQFVLTYHVIVGEIPSSALEPTQTVASAAEEALYITSGDQGVFVNGSAQVTTPDVTASNGIIHVIDEVLLPNPFIPVTGIVAKNYDLTTLLSLVAQREDILAALSDPDAEFTVFAPTNEAFDEALAAYPDLTEEEITEILTYHVLTSAVFSDDLSDGDTAETLQGEDITVTIDGETVLINSATVVTADLAGSNGVVHIIDAVILPPSYTED